MIYKKTRRSVVSAIVVATLGLSMGWSLPVMADTAENWPERAVNFVVPFPPGGPVDTAARFVTKSLAEQWGQAAIVDNRAGAGGIVAARHTMGLKPDGYNYLFPAIHHAILPSLRADLGYDIQEDFEPVGTVARFPIILVVHSSLPVNSVEELIAYAKEHPDEIAYSSSGTGGGTHLAGELFNSMAGVKLRHIPYRGSAPAMQDLVGGQVQVMFADAPSALPFMKSDKIKAIAVGNPERSSLAPELPTISESGVPNYEAYSWTALVAPKGTSKEVVAKMNADLQKALTNPETGPAMAAAGAEPMTGTPEEFATFLDNEIKKWKKTITDANIKIE